MSLVTYANIHGDYTINGRDLSKFGRYPQKGLLMLYQDMHWKKLNTCILRFFFFFCMWHALAYWWGGGGGGGLGPPSPPPPPQKKKIQPWLIFNFKQAYSTCRQVEISFLGMPQIAYFQFKKKKSKKLPTVGGGTPPSHTLPPLGRSAPSHTLSPPNILAHYATGGMETNSSMWIPQSPSHVLFNQTQIQIGWIQSTIKYFEITR